MQILSVPNLPPLPSLRTPARYLVEKAIGSGSMATVYQAWDRELKEPCALKLLRAGHPQAEDLCRRFLAEARIIADLDHPNIVKLHDSGVMPDGDAYLAMELLKGQDLQQLLAKSQRLPPAQALAIAAQVGDALSAVHGRGIVHRDIKPHNIFLCAGSDPAEVRVKVIDFGLSKVPSDSSREHSDGMIIGTLEYLAPEATLGISALVDSRSDQWALAVVCYRMLAGALPFSLGTDPIEGLVRIRSAAVRPLRELAPEIPSHVALAIERALSKDKESRFPSVRDFVDALLTGSQRPVLCTSTGLAAAAPRVDLQDAPTRIIPIEQTMYSFPTECDPIHTSLLKGVFRRHSFRSGVLRLCLAVLPLILVVSLRVPTAPSRVAASPVPVAKQEAPLRSLALPSRPAAIKNQEPPIPQTRRVRGPQKQHRIQSPRRRPVPSGGSRA